MPGQTEPPVAPAAEQPEPVAESETVALHEGDTTEAPAQQAVTEQAPLSEAEVQAGLPAGLPGPARDRLLAGRYADAAALGAAVVAEVAYVKALTGSGKPWGQGETQASEPVELTEEQKLERFNLIMREVGAREV